jgi:hypothetical protein
MISVALSKIVDGLKIPLNPPLEKGEMRFSLLMRASQRGKFFPFLKGS